MEYGVSKSPVSGFMSQVQHLFVSYNHQLYGIRYMLLSLQFGLHRDTINHKMHLVYFFLVIFVYRIGDLVSQTYILHI